MNEGLELQGSQNHLTAMYFTILHKKPSTVSFRFYIIFFPPLKVQALLLSSCYFITLGSERKKSEIYSNYLTFFKQFWKINCVQCLL